MRRRTVTIVGADTTRHVELIACGRYLGQELPSGTRVDLRCYQCNHRVATDQNSVRFHAAGAELYCNECLGVGLERLDAPDTGVC